VTYRTLADFLAHADLPESDSEDSSFREASDSDGDEALQGGAQGEQHMEEHSGPEEGGLGGSGEDVESGSDVSLEEEVDPASSGGDTDEAGNPGDGAPSQAQG
jgi:hypothetical protein